MSDSIPARASNTHCEESLPLWADFIVSYIAIFVSIVSSIWPIAAFMLGFGAFVVLEKCAGPWVGGVGAAIAFAFAFILVRLARGVFVLSISRAMARGFGEIHYLPELPDELVKELKDSWFSDYFIGMIVGGGLGGVFLLASLLVLGENTLVPIFLLFAPGAAWSTYVRRRRRGIVFERMMKVGSEQSSRQLS